MAKIEVIDRRQKKDGEQPEPEFQQDEESSEEVMSLLRANKAEITNIIAESSEQSIISGILNAIKRITDTKEISEAVKSLNLDQLWDLITSPPWVRPYIEPLRDEIQKRFAADPNISIKDAISNIQLDCKLTPGFIIVADLNGYSNFQYQATDAQKAELDESYQKEMFALCKKFSAKLLQAPAGDSYVFYVEKNLPEFLKALKASRIKVPLKRIDNEELYPNGYFTSSTGVAKSDGSDINLSLYTSQQGIRDGLIDVNGPAYVRAIDGQKHVGRNKMHVDFDTKQYLEDIGIHLDDVIVNDSNLAKVEVHDYSTVNYKMDPSAPERKTYIRLNGNGLPANKTHELALIAALAQASHPRGCISTIDKHDRGKESSINAVGVTSIAFQIGRLDDVGSKKDKYDIVIKKYFELRKKYLEFFTFKKDGEKLHVHTNLPLNEENGKKIVGFCRDMAKIITEEGFDVGIGVGYTETMVRTRIINSSVEERAGSGIVKSVRLGTAGRDLRLDAEFCKKAFGNIFEFEIVKAKGGDLMCLKIDLDKIDPENIVGKNLYGIDKEMESIGKFIEELWSNGNLLNIHSDISGSGVSALMRHALRIAIKSGVATFNIEKIGGDSYSYIRGLVCSFYPDLPKKINETDLLVKFDELLLDSETLNTKRLVVLDSKGINAVERPLLSRFASAIVTTKTALIHNNDFGGKKIEIKEMNVDDAVDMLMEINEIQLDEITDLVPLRLAITNFSKEQKIPITPRNIIYIFNVAVKKEGGRIFFDTNKSNGLKSGELGRKIRGVVSEERIFILSLIASIEFKTKAKILWPVYCKLKRISPKDLEYQKKERVFLDDLKYLVEHDLLEQSGEDFDLKDKNERESAVLLAVKIEEQFSRMLLDENAFDSNEIECLEAKFKHQLKAGGIRREIISACAKIAEYYFSLGMVSEARRVYTEYLKCDDYNGIQRSTLDFFMRMALSFHTGDDSQRKIAEKIYSKIELACQSPVTKTNIIWRRYRLCTLDGKNNAISPAAVSTIETSFEKTDLDGIFETREKQAIFKKLISDLKKLPTSDERDGIITVIEMDNLLRKVYTLRSLKDKRVIRKGELEEYYNDKKAEFKRELNALIGKDSKGTQEIRATFLRLCGGTSNQLGDPTSALDMFAEAESKFADLNPPDFFQINNTLQGAIESYDYLCRTMVNSKISTREETFHVLDELAAKIRQLESSAILSGDILNRANAMLGYCALCEYKIRAIAEAPNLDTDGELLREIISTNTRLAGDYVKLKLHHTKGADEETIRNNYKQIKDELATAIHLLPIELRA